MSFKSFDDSDDDNDYTVVETGKTTEGYRYQIRDYGPETMNSCCYINLGPDHYYYMNPDGSTYYCNERRNIHRRVPAPGDGKFPWPSSRYPPPSYGKGAKIKTERSPSPPSASKSHPSGNGLDVKDTQQGQPALLLVVGGLALGGLAIAARRAWA